MFFIGLSIEITRRCNFACEHCLRGDAQSKDLDIEQFKRTIDRLADAGLEDIDTIVFTGGEPLLNHQAMPKIMDILADASITIGRFYIATNGTIQTKEALDDILYCYNKCCDNFEDNPEIPWIEISRTQFHEEQLPEMKSGYIDMLKIAGHRGHIKYITQEGKAVGRWFANGRTYNDLPKEFCVEGDYTVEEVHLTVDCKFVPDCDYSYDHADELGVGVDEFLQIIDNTLEDVVNE